MGFWNKLFGRKPSPPSPPPGPGASSPSTATPPAADPQALFLEQVERLLRSDGAVEQVERHPSDYGLQVVRTGRTATIFLHRLFADTRELSPQEREHAIQSFLATVWQFEEVDTLSWEEARPRLRPTLRAVTFGLGPKPLEPGQEPVTRHPLPFLQEVLALDCENRMAYRHRRNLEAWGVSAEEAFTAAHANLAPLLSQGLERDTQAPGPLWTVESGDNYESSRLLHPGFLASFAGRVEGRPIAIVPERTTLWIAGDARPELVARLCESAEREWRASPRAISPALYTVDEAGRVVPYVRPGGDELAHRVRLGHRLLAASEYASQKDVLDEAKGGKEVAPYVATLSLMKRQADGYCSSYCVWSEGLQVQLPEADLVALRVAPEDLLLVPWADVRRLAGDCLVEVPGVWPPRYLTVSWPAPEAMAQLRAAARAYEDASSP